MLQQFTWQHFLVAALVLSLIWYVGVWLAFYRQGNKSFRVGDGFSRVPGDQLVVPKAKEQGLVQGDELMGKPKLPEGMALVGSEELRFAGNEGKADQVGLIPDLLRELKIVFQKIAERDGSKADFLRLLESVKSAYPKMGGHPQLAALNEFIIDHAPFHLTSEDIENLWY